MTKCLDRMTFKHERLRISIYRTGKNVGGKCPSYRKAIFDCTPQCYGKTTHLPSPSVFPLGRCKEDIRSGVSSLLVFVRSLKGLASIRDGVWDLLSSESISQHWSTVCQGLLDKPLSLWDDLLQQLFLQRLQVKDHIA